MDNTIIEGVIITPLKIIENPKGNIFHGLKKSSPGYNSFGEAYFSEIYYNEIKGWKKHKEMILNIIVSTGSVFFVLYDEREGSKTFNQYTSIELSHSNFCRLTIPPQIWFAFKGIAAEKNILLNIANIEHTPDESENLPLDNNKFKKHEW